jgi:hypothetical protein
MAVIAASIAMIRTAGRNHGETRAHQTPNTTGKLHFRATFSMPMATPCKAIGVVLQAHLADCATSGAPARTNYDDQGKLALEDQPDVCHRPCHPSGDRPIL